MEIEFLHKPFEHIIIHDAFEKDAIDGFYLEVEFLETFLRKDTKFAFDSNNPVEYSYRQDGGTSIEGYNQRVDKSGIFLSSFTDQYRNSHIYNNLKFLLKKNTYDVNNHNLLIGYLNSLKCQDFTILVSYYNHNSFYDVHFDTAILTGIYYLKPHGNCYVGGDLHFIDFNYTFVPEHNSFILFPSYIWHRVNKVSTEHEGTVRIAITAFIGN